MQWTCHTPLSVLSYTTRSGASGDQSGMETAGAR